MLSQPAYSGNSDSTFESAPQPADFRWNVFPCDATPLALNETLASGQAFRWRRDGHGIWWGLIDRTAVAAWQAQGTPDSPLHWQTFPEPDRWEPVANYLRLDVDLNALYAQWLSSEPRIAPAIEAFRGLRILRQPPEECFFAFQCAACNTVTKIERSVAHLAAHYGRPISTGLTEPAILHAFPTLDSLAEADESVLREGLWGYRAPRVIALAQHLRTLPPDWLRSLRYVCYAEAHAALAALFGVGAKIADCVCLFALDKDEAAPIDTHLRRVAVEWFRPDMSGRSLTPRVYHLLADSFRDRFGHYAGWAQQLLFLESLRRGTPAEIDG